MKKTGKIIIGTIIGLIIIIVIAWQVMAGIDVEVEKVIPRTITRSFTEEGFARARIEYTVYPMFRGRIDSLEIEDRMRVEKGDLLLTLDDRELRYQMRELEAILEELKGEEMKLTEVPSEAEIEELNLAVRQAQAALEAAERHYNNMKALYEDKAVSEERYLEALDRVINSRYAWERQKKAIEVLHESYDPPPGSREVIEARRQAYLSQMDVLQYHMEEYRIFAPLSGYIGRLDHEEKEMADIQVPLMTIFQEDEILIDVKVLDRDVMELEMDMKVEVQLELKNKWITFPGKIQKIGHHAEKDISPLGLEERRVKVTVLPEVPEDIFLRPGHEVDVVFITDQLSDQLVIPKISLFRYEGEDALFIVENNRAVIRQVTTGFETQREVVITDGLEKGARIILNPRVTGLQEGSRVQEQQ